MMNTEKLNTALSYFVADFRTWLPEKLTAQQVQQCLDLLSKSDRSAYLSTDSRAKQHELLIDIGSLAKMAANAPSILAPSWKGSIQQLQTLLTEIKNVRNNHAHHTADLTLPEVEAALKAMAEVLEGFQRSTQARHLRVLHIAFQASNAAHSSSMTANWRKRLQAKRALVWMEIFYQEPRPDVQNFLKAFVSGGNSYQGDHAELVRARLVRHFTELGLIAGQQLTEKGQAVLRSGMLRANEMGKYRICWIPSAPLLQGRIVYFERHRAEHHQQDKARHTHLGLSLEQHFKLASDKSAKPLPFEIKASGNPDLSEDFTEQVGSTATFDMHWRWESLQKTHLYLTGNIQDGKDKDTTFPTQELAIDLAPLTLLMQVFPDWNTKRQRLAVEMENRNNEALKSFAQDFNFENQFEFDRIEFKRVPLMPKDKVNASKWRDALLVFALQADYLAYEAWQAKCLEMIALPAFLDYQLDSPTPVSFLQRHFADINASHRGAEFWHLAAPHDLSPTTTA